MTFFDLQQPFLTLSFIPEKETLFLVVPLKYLWSIYDCFLGPVLNVRL